MRYRFLNEQGEPTAHTVLRGQLLSLIPERQEWHVLSAGSRRVVASGTYVEGNPDEGYTACSVQVELLGVGWGPCVEEEGHSEDVPHYTVRALASAR
jgi:hypothetical protein